MVSLMLHYSIRLMGTYFEQALKRAADTEHIPRIRVKMCRTLPRARPDRMWQLDRRLAAGSQIEAPREAKVNDVRAIERDRFVEQRCFYVRN